MATMLSYIVLLIYIAGDSLALLKSELFPFGSETYLPSKDDVSSPEVHLTVPIIFYGTEYRSIYVNDNGLLSFLNEVPAFFNGQFPLTYPVIAPLYADVDIRSSGRVYYRETQAPELLGRAARDIRKHFSSSKSFQPRSLFIATWDEVGYYDRQKDKINTFQAVVASDGEDSYAYFLYPSVQWIRSQGKKNRNLLDARAHAGFVSGDGRLYTLRGSGTKRVRNFDRMSNAKEAGLWMFHIGRPFRGEGNVMPADLDASDDRQGENSRSIRSADTLLPCPPHSSRVDLTDRPGFCCICKDGYFGNGRICVKKNSTQIMNGKVSGIMNEVQLNDSALQAYIFTEDGRTYTAISRIPPAIGFHLQVLTPLGGVFGWMFAVSRSGAPNGFMITGGVFNRTTEVDFPTSRHHVLIEETFLGPDVSNHIRVQVKFSGNVPSIPLGTHIEIPDYEEEYNTISHGEIRSQSHRFYRLEGNSLRIPFTIDQSISYFPNPDCEIPMTNTRLEVTMNTITYDADQQIVRYAMTNKISPPNDSMEPVYCKNPGTVANARVLLILLMNREQPLDPDEILGQYPEGSRLQYSCKEGYTLMGPPSLTCENTGNWLPATLPMCAVDSMQPVYCKNPGTVANALVLHILLINREQPLDPDAILGQYPEGSSLRYSCEEGYTLMGPPSLTCENTGNWSPGTLPTCAIDVYCKNPGTVANARELHIIQEKYPEGSSLRYSCEEDYILMGPPSLTCEDTGNWSPATLPTCAIGMDDFLAFNFSNVTEKLKKVAEVELNEKESETQDALIALKDLLRNETNLNPYLDDAFLLTFLRVGKFDVLESVDRIKNYYSARVRCPSMFANFTPSSCLKVLRSNIHYFLPYRSLDGCPILLSKFGLWDLKLITGKELLKFILISYEKALENPVTQISGAIGIVDMTGFSWVNVLETPPMDFLCFFHTLLYTLPLRMKAIHFINHDTILPFLFNMAKTYLIPEVTRKIHFHEDLESLHQYVPPAILPEYLGGELIDSPNEDFYDSLLNSDEIFNAGQHYGYTD